METASSFKAARQNPEEQKVRNTRARHRNFHRLGRSGTRALVAALLIGSSACRSAARAQEVSRVSPESTTQAGGDVDLVGTALSEAKAATRTAPRVTTRMGTRTPAARVRFRNRADSLSWVRSVRAAQKARGFRLEVSLNDKMLLVINGADTLRTAPIAVGMGSALNYGGRRWFFETPRGRRKVLRKEADPVWTPPEWAYAEVAHEYGLKLRALPGNKPFRLKDGRLLAVRDSLVGVIERSEATGKREWAALPSEEHIVFDNTLFIPPITSKNRRISGELGKYRLDLGEGYLLHGTPHQDSIGRAATHGCVRLLDEDIEWLYQNVPVGTAVYIY